MELGGPEGRPEGLLVEGESVGEVEGIALGEEVGGPDVGKDGEAVGRDSHAHGIMISYAQS